MYLAVRKDPAKNQFERMRPVNLSVTQICSTYRILTVYRQV